MQDFPFAASKYRTRRDEKATLPPPPPPPPLEGISLADCLFVPRTTHRYRLCLSTTPILLFLFAHRVHDACYLSPSRNSILLLVSLSYSS
jgi:hypothetical protein